MILLSAAGLSMFAAINAEEIAVADNEIVAVNIEEIAAAENEIVAVNAQEVAVTEGEIAADCTVKKPTCKPTPPPCKPKPEPVCKPKPKPVCKPKPKPKPKCEPKPKPVCKTECVCEEEERSYVYFSGRGGANFLHASEKHDIKLHPKVGYAVGGALGYRWWFNLDLEAEFTYRYNGVCSVEFLEHEVIACGNVNSFSYMANIVYHIPYSFTKCSITPYFGGGVGYIHQHAKACPFEFPGEGEKGGFGWQVMAGFKQRLYKCFELSAEYRFNKGPLDYLYNQTANFAFTFLF